MNILAKVLGKETSELQGLIGLLKHKEDLTKKRDSLLAEHDAYILLCKITEPESVPILEACKDLVGKRLNLMEEDCKLLRDLILLQEQLDSYYDAMEESV
ncbi:hypothetical protein LCGC14_0683520 [marine sediment metagenome]|uniref:Uncharacterized protein n=1 Tax=marine sediment metagenome TaxID=412755 RepID=A0A0F9T8S8_9ZZZZ